MVLSRHLKASPAARAPSWGRWPALPVHCLTPSPQFRPASAELRPEAILWDLKRLQFKAQADLELMILLPQSPHLARFIFRGSHCVVQNVLEFTIYLTGLGFMLNLLAHPSLGITDHLIWPSLA